MNIKQTLQSEQWQDFLSEQEEGGNEDARVILDYMKRNRWLRSQRKERAKPNLRESTDWRRHQVCGSFRIQKPKTEV